MSQRAPPLGTPSEAVPVPPGSSSIHTLLIQGDGFRNAHSFSIHHPLIAEQINIDTQHLSSALSWICAHTMRGVEFSSAVRDPPPRCYPGTREALTNQVLDWLDDPRSRQRVFCLTGPAGAGKSALSQSLAECTIIDKKHCGASLFLERAASASSSNDPSRLWTTISYRLATSQPSYALRMQQEIARDLKLVEQSMVHQFRSLIMEPIGRDRLLSESPYLIPIFIDGLDKYHQIRTQERMIHAILGFVQAYPEAPLVWIISFRPERHILKAFSQYTDLGESITTIDLSINSEDACRDVQLFLRGEFGRIQGLYDIVTPWPIEEDFVRLFVAASGLFMFAFAIICFCENSDVEDPVGQLNIIFSTPCFQPETPANDSVEQDPLLPVYLMYEQILRSVQSKQYETARRILGFLLLPNGFGSWASDSTTFWSLCNILGIHPYEAYTCLSKLASVLAIPSREDATRAPIRFLHNSFPQYLANEAISKQFCIDVRKVVADLWHCHLRALMEANASVVLLPDPSLIQMIWALASHEERKNSHFRASFWENARRMFFHHLLPCPSRFCPSGSHYNALSDPRDPSLLVEVFKKMKFDRLVDGYAFPDVPHRFIAFLDWLVQLEEDHPLRREGFIEFFDVSRGWNYNVDLSGLAFKIHVEHCDNDGYFITFKSYANLKLRSPVGIDKSRLFSIREQPETFSNLQQELDLREQIVAINVMGNCRVMVDNSAHEQKFYYILPLATEVWSDYE